MHAPAELSPVPALSTPIVPLSLPCWRSRFMQLALLAARSSGSSLSCPCCLLFWMPALCYPDARLLYFLEASIRIAESLWFVAAVSVCRMRIQ